MPTVQIVSFDYPYPPNYGGVIDVYYKILALHRAGVEVILHAFEYKKPSDIQALQPWCKKIYIYKRKKGLIYFFHYLPYTVLTRKNPELNRRLKENGSPVIFEVMNTTGALSDPEIRKMQTLYRHSNIEHRYYYQLARDEKNIFRKIFYYTEALKFFFYEKQLRFVKAIAAVNENDAEYYRKKFSCPVWYIPSFHPFCNIVSLTGKGKYVLFHGNLSVNENIRSAEWIVQKLAPLLPEISFIIAGMRPPKNLIQTAKNFTNVQILCDVPDEKMNELIRHAHVHLLLTNNPEGLKLKWLYAFYSGRFMIVSGKILPKSISNYAGPCGIWATEDLRPEDIARKIKELMQQEFTAQFIESRKQYAQEWDVSRQAGKIISWIESAENTKG